MPKPRAPKPKKPSVTFKTDAELADFLRALPNRSEFIRRAILAQLRRRCPLCLGKGVVAIGVCEHYAGILNAAGPPPAAG